MENSHGHYNTDQVNAQDVELRIDPEFVNEITPIGEEEFRQLRENVLSVGEVYESLKVWNGVLVDGHNRWKIIQENPSIKYSIRQMDFPDKWAAFEWMHKNQLGRRNLTDEQRTVEIGKLYKVRKKSVGAPTGNSNAEKQTGQNDRIVSRRETRDGTAGQIGKEYGMSEKNVRRAEKYADGIDAILKVKPDVAEKVLNGEIRVPKTAIASFSHIDPDDVEAAVETMLAAMSGEQSTNHAKRPRRVKTEEEKQDLKEIQAIVDDMCDPTTTPEFTIDLLIEDIEVNADVYVQLLRNTLTDRSNLVTDENKPRIAAAIDKVVENIMKVRETL